MDFRILGPLEVLDGDRAVRLGGNKQRALLALLLVHANETVSTDRLMDELWGERLPETSAKTLQMQVSRLRRTLTADAGGNPVLTRERGYELRIDPRQLDSLEFARLREQGGNELAAGRPAVAVELLEDALSLWHAPLADLAYEPFAQGEIARLEELRVATLEHLIEAKLQLGGHAEVIVQLEALIAEHPYRERLRAQLMLSLYRCDRQADALKAYQDARLQLVEELGIEPGERLRELERQILVHDPLLTAPEHAAGPRGRDARPRRDWMPEGTVTLLFTDLVGSTGLLEELGEGAAEEVRRDYFGLLRRAVAAHRGTDVKSMGDGLMVVFGSALDAVNSAVAMQRAIDRRNRKDRFRRLQVRIGLTVGEPIHEEDDYFGTPVVVAKRLCDHAEGGQIIASDLVRVLVGGRGKHAFVDLGALSLKGLGEPRAAVEIPWQQPVGEQSMPLPGRLRDLSGQDFVGRAVERRRLQELFDRASDGDCRVALISGEPGIGKTRLAVHVALEARSRGATVIYGRSDEDLPISHGPWMEALSHYIDHASEDVLRAHVERHGGELTRIVPALEERVPDVPRPREGDADTQRYLLWGAVAGLLSEASEAEPLVLVLDDLHSADKPSLRLLKHVVTQTAEMHALIIGTYRESEVADGHLLDALTDLRRETSVEQVSLAGLGEAEVAQLVERAAGPNVDRLGRHVSRELLRETAGNPFYTVELLRHLLDSGAISRDAGGRSTGAGDLLALGFPQSVREVVTSRVQRLGEHAVEVLSTAAVIGRDFDVDLLARVVDRSEDDLLGLLEQAVTSLLLAESTEVVGRFTFAHALVNHTLYGNLGATRRARMHRKVAEALEERLGPEPGTLVTELAHHWARTEEVASNAKALAYAKLAGQRALSQLAPDEALSWFDRALALQSERATVDAGEKCELLIGLGEAQRQAGDPASRATLLEASKLACSLGDATLAARAAIANNRGVASSFEQVDAERLAALENALELDRFDHPALCARLISLQAVELEPDVDHERRRALAEEALALARTLGDPSILAPTLHEYCFATFSPDTLQRRRALIPELLEQARLANDPALEFFAVTTHFHVSMESAALEEGFAAARRSREIAEELHQPSLRWFAHYFAAGLAMVPGDLAEAERLAEEALQIGTAAGQPDAYFIYGGLINAVRIEQDRVAEVLPLLQQLVEALPGIPTARAALAHMYALLGRNEDGAAILEQATGDRFDHVPYDQLRLVTLVQYAAAASELDDKHAAALLYELIDPWRDQIVWFASGTSGHVRIYLGRLASTLGWDEQADEHFAIACDFQERNGMPLWEAHSRLGWAEALASRGELDRASAEAARALALARDHGYAMIETRAAALAPN